MSATILFLFRSCVARPPHLLGTSALGDLSLFVLLIRALDPGPRTVLRVATEAVAQTGAEAVQCHAVAALATAVSGGHP